MTLDDMTGCYGPSEMKRMNQVFDEIWAEVGSQFRNASPEFIACVRNRLALVVLDVRCETAAELKLRALDAFRRRFSTAA